MTIYSDSGFSFFEDTSSYAAHYAKVCGHFFKLFPFVKFFEISWYYMYLIQGCYASASWDIRPATVATNTASQTIARAPGTTPVRIFN